MPDPAPQATPTVWQIYRSRFLYVQLFVLAACAFIWWYRQNIYLAGMTFCMLQVVAVYGAWMSKRLLDQIAAQTRNERRTDQK